MGSPGELALEHHTASVNVNMLNVDELDRVVEAYGGPEKYERMGAVKAKYDPTNLFRMNHNIKPAAAAASA